MSDGSIDLHDRRHRHVSVEDVARRFVRFVVAALLLGALANLVLLANLTGGALALRPHESGDLSALVQTEQQSVRIRYNFEAMLHDVLGAGTLVVPDLGLVDAVQIRNLAQMNVAVVDYETEIDAGTAARLRTMGIESTGALRNDGTDQTFVIVARDPPDEESRYRLLLSDGLALVVDVEVLREMGL